MFVPSALRCNRKTDVFCVVVQGVKGPGGLHILTLQLDITSVHPWEVELVH